MSDHWTRSWVPDEAVECVRERQRVGEGQSDQRRVVAAAVRVALEHREEGHERDHAHADALQPEACAQQQNSRENIQKPSGLQNQHAMVKSQLTEPVAYAERSERHALVVVQNALVLAQEARLGAERANRRDLCQATAQSAIDSARAAQDPQHCTPDSVSENLE